MVSLHPCRLAPIKALRALARKLGSKKAAERLHVSHKTVREALSSGVVPARVQAEKAWKLSERASKGWKTRKENLYLKEERAGIRATSSPTTVPGYGPQKLARVLQQIRHMRGENSIEHQDIKYTIRGLERQKLPIDPSLYENLARLQRLDIKLRDIEFHMAPADTIEERLYKVNNIDKEYREIARTFNLSARAVYSLYYSPPAGPLA